MKTDRTTKVLLGLIAAGLWTSLLRPLWVATPSEAKPARAAAVAEKPVLPAAAASPGAPAIALHNGQDGLDIYVAEGGRIYRFDRALGRPRAGGVYGPNVKLQPDPTGGP